MHENSKDNSQLDQHRESVITLDKDTPLLAVAMNMERKGPIEYRYDRNTIPHENVEGYVDTYTPFVRLWLRFEGLKGIYPFSNKRKNNELRCSMKDIMEIETDPSRWVEVPDDYRRCSIAELSTYYHQHFPKQLVIGDDGTVMCLNNHPLKKHGTYSSTDPTTQRYIGRGFSCSICGIQRSSKDCEDPSALFSYCCEMCHILPCNDCYLEQISSEQSKDETKRKVVEIAVEFFDQELNQWPNASPSPQSQSVAELPVDFDTYNKQMEWAQTLKVGDIVDAKDEEGKWYEVVIRYIEGSDDDRILYIHYIGWNTKWDEKVPASHVSRIQRRGTNTDGPHRYVSRSRYQY